MPYCAVLSEVLFNPTASHTHLAYILELVLVAENASDIFQNTSELLWLHVKGLILNNSPSLEKMCSCAAPCLTVLHPLGCTAPGLPSACSERLQTTATDLTASTSRRPPRTSRRTPPSFLLKQDTIYFNTGDFFSSLTQMSVAYLLPYWEFLRSIISYKVQ